MNQELESLASQLAKATKPEDVFGGIWNEVSLRRSYHCMAKVAHPDVHLSHEDKVLAQVTFGRLAEWFEQAEEKIRSGRYGKKERIVIQTKTREYEIEDGFTEDGMFNFYSCRYVDKGQNRRALLRIVRDPCGNDISQNEIRILDILLNGRDAKKFSPYIPNLLDAFMYDDDRISRHSAVFEKYDGWYPLDEVHGAYPHGIDPKDMAWMWRRLLVVLGFAHANSVIHGAVLPGNIWIQPEQHGLMLKNWFFAVQAGEVISKTDPSFAGWYPQEILKYEIPTFGTDISMSARCMIHLLGGDAKTGSIPSSIPNAMRAFLRGSILPGRRTPQDAWAVKQDLDELLQRLWGERKFHPFKMNFTH
jgi:hypothetical protein